MNHAVRLTTWFYLVALVAVPTFAQVSIRMESLVIHGGDSVSVSVFVDSVGDSLTVPYSSFQFQVETEGGIVFLDANDAFTLTSKQGWTNAFNKESGRVGGFSSSQDAVNIPGVLINMLFLRTDDMEQSTIRLTGFRLNSGVPEHSPPVPEIVLEGRAKIE